jgi:putative transposase
MDTKLRVRGVRAKYEFINLLRGEFRASCTVSQGICGAPRIVLDLREAGATCSKHRIERPMRENGLRALHGDRTRRWSVGMPAVVIPNLLQRQFRVTRPSKSLVTDIT